MSGVDVVALVADLARRGLRVAAAESLTAGLVSARIADVPGASAVLRGGVVAYATELKAELLGVDPALLAEHGPVHPQVALQMARGVAARTGADIGVATTGVAGPGPADGHPAGTVVVAAVLVPRPAGADDAAAPGGGALPDGGAPPERGAPRGRGAPPDRGAPASGGTAADRSVPGRPGPVTSTAPGSAPAAGPVEAVEVLHLAGGRGAVRAAAVEGALALLAAVLAGNS